MKKKQDLRKRKKISIFIICVSMLIILYSLINIFIWLWDNYKIRQEINQIGNDNIITKPSDIEMLDSEKRIEEGQLLYSDPYWKIINSNYLQVDFTNLKENNSEVVAWINVAGTEVNYPVVQHSDNEYYLNHSLNRSQNGAGWVFLDYRNQMEKLDQNTIIYAHARKNGIMFGSLKNVLSSAWYENENNYVIKMSNEFEDQLWQIFSVYRIPTTTDYLQNNFLSDESTLEFLNKIKERSIFDFHTTITVNNKVLTLSTCHNSNERIVVHAKLIRSKKRI
ncbi:MAG: class B sortase [Clostridia bacterium]|nr:class B sortase [Clostridia bacterium]MCI8914939.1 class B sortase [Lawsonibacter sp.]